MVRSLAYLKSLWITAFKPTQTDYSDVFDTIFNPDNKKVYHASITQIGTNAPTVVIWKNTVGNIVWTYQDVGKYWGVLSGAFPDQTKIPVINGFTNLDQNDGRFCGQADFEGSENIFRIQTLDPAGNYTNDYLLNTQILIEIYP